MASAVIDIASLEWGPARERLEPDEGGWPHLRDADGGTSGTANVWSRPAFGGARQPRVLMVDDRPPFREVFRFAEALTIEGYSVRVADEFREALERVAGDPFDLALLDLQLPGMDAWRTLTAMRDQRPEMRILVICDGRYEQLVAKRHVDGILVRPFGRSTMLAFIRQACELPQRGLRVEPAESRRGIASGAPRGHAPTAVDLLATDGQWR